VDVVWCRDVLVHVADLTGAFREFKRILRQDGRAVTYQMLGTERLEPTETAWLWTVMGVVPASADRQRVEAAVTAAGLRIIESIDLSTEWGEWGQEHNGSVGRKLLHAARLLRDPERYRSQFGAPAYDMMLGDCLWHVYAMIGKLTRRAYVLGP
jgi:SAM-dependent methyltransferase